MINHVVLMKFNPSVTEADIEELERIMDDLPNKIIEIHAYEFGRDLVRSNVSYDFALVSLFANLDALQRYQAHPAHLAILRKLTPICESIAAVDFEGSDTASTRIEKPIL